MKDYAKGRSQRTDDLFFEYARLLRGFMPRAFVAENVKGLVIGKAKGYFKEILRELRSAGYRVRARILDAQWLGVPQSRQRVIFVGTREDLDVDPPFPSPLRHRYTTRDAIPHARGQVVKTAGWDRAWGTADRPHAAIVAGSQWRSGVIQVREGATLVRRRLTIEECKAICSFPPDFEMPGSFEDKWRALGMSVPPLMMRAIALELYRVLEASVPDPRSR